MIHKIDATKSTDEIADALHLIFSKEKKLGTECDIINKIIELDDIKIIKNKQEENIIDLQNENIITRIYDKLKNQGYSCVFISDNQNSQKLMKKIEDVFDNAHNKIVCRTDPTRIMKLNDACDFDLKDYEYLYDHDDSFINHVVDFGDFINMNNDKNLVENIDENNTIFTAAIEVPIYFIKIVEDDLIKLKNGHMHKIYTKNGKGFYFEKTKNGMIYEHNICDDIWNCERNNESSKNSIISKISFAKFVEQWNKGNIFSFDILSYIKKHQ